MLLAFTIKVNAQNITTIGLGYPFSNSGMAEIIRDTNGNLFISEAMDELIMKIEPNNKTTVISAGNGKPGAIAFDYSGNLYVAYVDSGTNTGKVFKMNSDGTNPVLFANPNTSITNLEVFGNYLWYTTSALSNKLGRINLTDGAITLIDLPASIANTSDFTFDTQGNSYFVNSVSNSFLQINNTFTTYFHSPASVTHLTCIDYCPNIGLVAGGLSDIVILSTSGNPIANYPLPVFQNGYFSSAIEARDFQNAHLIMFENGQNKVYDFKYPDNTFKIRGSIFNSPKSVTLDAAQNIYMTSNDPLTSYNQVKKLSFDVNNYMTMSSLYNSVNQLEGISFNSNNNMLYFADKTANTIKYVSSNGSTIGDEVTGLSNPYMFKTKNSTDYYSQRNLSYIVGRRFQGFPPQFLYSNYGSFGDPKGFDFDNSGNVYVADYDFNIIEKININSSAITILSGFNKPSAVAVDTQNGYLYVSDTESNAIKRTNLDGSNIITISNSFNKPEGIFLNSTTNKLYVADTGNNVLKIIDLSGFLSNVEVSSKTELKIYPNPTSDIVFIENPKNLKIDNVQIFDMLGKKIAENQNAIENKISLATFPTGVYVMKITFEDETTGTKNIIKK